MNVDTDTQYAFTRPVAGHMFTQLRRRAQGRRRGRQQEGVRPARLGQGGRGGHGQARRRRPARTCARPAPRWPSSARHSTAAGPSSRAGRGFSRTIGRLVGTIVRLRQLDGGRTCSASRGTSRSGTTAPRRSPRPTGPGSPGSSGRPLDGAWLMWDIAEPAAGSPHGPVILGFGDVNVEVTHRKFDECAITWDQVDMSMPPDWPGLPLDWRPDAHPALRRARGRRLREVNIIERIMAAHWRPRVLHAVEFLFDGRPAGDLQRDRRERAHRRRRDRSADRLLAPGPRRLNRRAVVSAPL